MLKYTTLNPIYRCNSCADPDIFLGGGGGGGGGGGPTENALVLLYDTLISGFQWV